MRIAIVGNGRMGQAVAARALALGHSIHSTIGAEENAGGRALTRERLKSAEVAIEFTTPEAVVANLERLIEAGVPTVTGTTGWYAELPRITALVRERGGALLHAANFSVGVQLFLRAAQDLSRRFAGQPGFDASIVEEHHEAKRDAPSGTARVLQTMLRGIDQGRDFPISSVREGTLPGTHTVRYDAPPETIELRHVSRNRDAFAAGAVAAATWLPGHPGVHTFEEMLFGQPT